MPIDITTVLSPLIGFIIGIAVKSILDFNLAPFIVKYFWWISVRTIFRTDPNKISGLWEQTWDAVSTLFPEEVDRHSNISIKQFANYCYGEFSGKGKRYCVFGKIEQNYFIGNWYDANDKLGYFGTFQLNITDATAMNGLWIGHSKKRHEIKQGAWRWRKIP